ncbi:unnamed protein product [Cuscuta epithymum]|uniref:DUF220 domain-containing protein n=1 Tax=Cuscuta epithymum TaxID=186058 RepID=A0AAV0DEX9_9ASTE|nr:unnamed protein product [Cuscuta epithymum]
MKLYKQKPEIAMEESNGPPPRLPTSVMHSVYSHFQSKIGKPLEVNFERLKRGGDVLMASLVRKNEASLVLDVDLENQMQPWKENPVWTDHPPDIKVTIPEGSLCKMNVTVDVGLPPDAVYNIVTDPENKKVFKNIQKVVSRKVLVDEGSRQVVELEQAALWRFLCWSGTISVHVLVDQNREDRTMKFKQVKTGFMKKFEGCWRVEPLLVDEDVCHLVRPKNLADYVLCTEGKGRVGSRLSLEQLIQPALVPPPPISWYIRGITTKTTEMIINDLLAETARIRSSSSMENSRGSVVSSNERSSESQFENLGNIKERWASRRKKTRKCGRRLSCKDSANK